MSTAICVYPSDRCSFCEMNVGPPLNVQSVCLLRNAHNQDPETPAFYLELEPGQSLPLDVRQGHETGIRITYEVDSANGDTSGDGVPDPDVAVLVVHSNASNQPILMVPVCGRVVTSGEPQTWPCTLPNDVMPPSPDTGDCVR